MNSKKKKEQLIMRIDRDLDAQWQERTHTVYSGEPQKNQDAMLAGQDRAEG
jgi:hypothetical protein